MKDTINTLADLDRVLKEPVPLVLERLRTYGGKSLDTEILFKKSKKGFFATIKCTAIKSQQFSVEKIIEEMDLHFKLEIVTEGKRSRGWLYVLRTKRTWVRVDVDFHVLDMPVHLFLKQLSKDVEGVMVKPNIYFEDILRGSLIEHGVA